jgi:hypothetical protein
MEYFLLTSFTNGKVGLITVDSYKNHKLWSLLKAFKPEHDRLSVTAMSEKEIKAMRLSSFLKDGYVDEVKIHSAESLLEEYLCGIYNGLLEQEINDIVENLFNQTLSEDDYKKISTIASQNPRKLIDYEINKR